MGSENKRSDIRRTNIPKVAKSASAWDISRNLENLVLRRLKKDQ